MICTLNKSTPDVAAGTTGYGIRVGLEDATPAYAVVFPNPETGDGARLILLPDECTIVDDSSAGEDIYNGE